MKFTEIMVGVGEYINGNKLKQTECRLMKIYGNY